MSNISSIPCPYLPPPPASMDASALTAHGSSRGADFYLTALTYGHYLWLEGQYSRAILKLDRALGADLHDGDAILHEWPLPYAAMAWILRHAPKDGFVGNPRVHFQHLADRMNEPRREQRSWRIWGCWALCRKVRPDLTGDPRHVVQEPDFDLISRKLELHGLRGEAALWQDVYRNVA